MGDQAQTIYAVFSGLHYNNECCSDYGNAERVPIDDGAGTMEALYFGSAKGGMNHGGDGPGPWLMGDLEKGESPSLPSLFSLPLLSPSPPPHP